MGELALTENKLALAQEEFEKAAQLNPSLAEAYLGLSRVALLDGDLEKAKPNANKALELDPHLLKDGRLQRGTVLWRLGQLDEAVTELEKAKEEDPRSVTIPITLGAVLYEKGDCADAEKNLQPGAHPRALQPRGRSTTWPWCKAKRSEYTGAIEQMKLAVEKAPKRADYHYALGDIYRKDERFAEAIDAVEGDHQAGSEERGRLRGARPRVPGDAARWRTPSPSLEAALKVDPKRKRVLGAIGDAFFSAGRWDEAITRYEKALKEDPGAHLRLLQDRPRLVASRSSTPRPSTGTRRPSPPSRTTPMAYYYLGYSYKEKGKKKDAAAAFQKYLELKPERRGQARDRGRDRRPRVAPACPPRRPLPGVAGQVQLAVPVPGGYKPPPMLDLRYVAQNFDAVVARLKTRSGNLDLGPFQRARSPSGVSSTSPWRRCPPAATPPTRR